MAAKNTNDVVSSYNCTVTGDSVTFTMKLADGQELTYNSNEYPQNVVLELLAYGLKQKMADAVASRTAKDWTEDDVAEKLNGLHESMKNGSFTSRAPGQALTTQVETAKERLETFLSKTDTEKALLAQMGVTESALRKALASLTTKLAKSLKA